MRIGSFVRQQDLALGVEGTNICGVLVRSWPERVDDIRQTLNGWDGVEVHMAEADGRMVVTVEDTAEEWAGQIITRMAALDGLLATTLIYHHCETGDLDKEPVT